MKTTRSLLGIILELFLNWFFCKYEGIYINSDNENDQISSWIGNEYISIELMDDFEWLINW